MNNLTTRSRIHSKSVKRLKRFYTCSSLLLLLLGGVLLFLSPITTPPPWALVVGGLGAVTLFGSLLVFLLGVLIPSDMPIGGEKATTERTVPNDEYGPQKDFGDGEENDL